MVRKQWRSLNGLWDYSIRDLQADKPKTWTGRILVPFPVESMLSGVRKNVGPEHMLWYRKKFSLPAAWKGQRILLHFEAVDWETNAWLNGKPLGLHQGGYDAFSYDITDALQNGEQELVLSVWDPSNDGYQPAGKQYNNPRSIWYTSTTGIWQSVWLEPVPSLSIADLSLVPDLNDHSLKIVVPLDATGCSVRAVAYDGHHIAGSVTGAVNDTLRLPLDHVKTWSPDSPFLYDLVLYLYSNGKIRDSVRSYFGMREVRLAKDEAGITRIFLNGKPQFEYGPLDQGFWPDGIYTAPTDDALKYDIAIEKELGFNMIRKHVKVEPKRWYYWCDQLGMLVWQDMPSGDQHIRKDEADITRTAQSSYQYRKELKAMINGHFNSPCIVAWVPFNEGWGQWQTDTVVQLIRRLDPTRLISESSGWSDRKTGDMSDIHVYPGPDMPPLESARAAVLGEFGGQALVIPGHLWQSDLSRAPGHIRTSQTKEELQQVYEGLIQKLLELKRKGLSAAVYTQTTDVETEVNGIMTYDRALIKMDTNVLKELHRKVIE